MTVATLEQSSGLADEGRVVRGTEARVALIRLLLVVRPTALADDCRQRRILAALELPEPPLFSDFEVSATAD